MWNCAARGCFRWWARCASVVDLLVFTTGYEPWALPEAYADVPRCDKPVDRRQPARAMFGGQSPHRPFVKVTN